MALHTRQRGVPLGITHAPSGQQRVLTIYSGYFNSGISLCQEYTDRFWKKHACESSIRLAALTQMDNGCPEKHTPFVRAMPDELKYRNDIDTITAYRMYLSTKEWALDNYRVPDKKPSWLPTQPLVLGL